MVFVFEGYKRLCIQVIVKAFGTSIQKFECCVPCDDYTACSTLIVVIKQRIQMEPIAKNTDNHHHLLTLTNFVFLQNFRFHIKLKGQSDFVIPEVCLTKKKNPFSKQTDGVSAKKPETGTKRKKSGNTPELEIGGSGGPDPTRFGDWEKDGRCVDF